jgi:prepilin-type N-terminal cleavage/methylation domain
MNILSRSKINKIHSGVTLLEVIAVIMILGGILYAYLGRQGTANDQASVNTEQGHIAMLSNGISGNLWQSSGYPTGDLYSFLKDQKLIPSDMTDSGTGMKNSYGGAVVATGATTYYTISSANLPKQACIKLAMQLSKSGSFATTTINGTALTGEVSPAQGSSGCSSDSNTVVWKSTI